MVVEIFEAMKVNDLAFKEYVMTTNIKLRLLNHRQRCQNRIKSHNRYRQTHLDDLICKTCEKEIFEGDLVRSRPGFKCRSILRHKACDIKVFGNGKEL